MTSRDRDLFRDALSDVIPLKPRKIATGRTPPAPLPVQTNLDQRAVMDSLATGSDDPEETETGDELVWLRPGVQRSVLRKLRRGDFVVTRELDLHGHRVASARTALSDFIRQARFEDQRCVRIIHGKGLRSPGKTPVLKAKVFGWLRRRRDVLAITTARPSDGGTGAVYVILSRRS
ncbi:MAG: Smr/MutS family endonuclease [Gammaproteobacteria bacterium]|nr:Smr/MutS family endonuclease [Gammaproteobacteria bacterium]